ncbi:hypothetical protein QBC44DRAFT_390819, partial [Cladorrhinum sp. PSN332]
TVGELPVFLVRTGVQEGLSGPISFDSISKFTHPDFKINDKIIKTDLETAIDFVLCLEAREAAAYGLQPDTLEVWNSERASLSQFYPLGPGEALVGPSSRWEDMANFPWWEGEADGRDNGWMKADWFSQRERSAFALMEVFENGERV